MVGILEFFQAAPVGVTDSVRADPYSAHWVAGAPYKLHSMVGAALFFSSCLVFVREALGEHIHCIQDQDGSKVTKGWKGWLVWKRTCCSIKIPYNKLTDSFAWHIVHRNLYLQTAPY